MRVPAYRKVDIVKLAMDVGWGVRAKTRSRPAEHESAEYAPTPTHLDTSDPEVALVDVPC